MLFCPSNWTASEEESGGEAPYILLITPEDVLSFLVLYRNWVKVMSTLSICLTYNFYLFIWCGIN